MKEITAGTVIVKDEVRLPPGMAIETQPCGLGWKALTNMDGYGFGRAVREAGWNFFCLADTKTLSVLGGEGPARSERGAKEFAARWLAAEFNAFEITAVTPRTFMGIPFVKISARLRHIQQSMHLVPDWSVSTQVEVARNGSDSSGDPVGAAQIVPGVRAV